VILRRGTDTVTVAPGARATFGRSTETDLPVGADPVDHRVSRRAGEVRFDGGTWIVVNTGRRSLFLVEPAGETELSPGGAGRSEVPVVYDGCWVRVPGHGVDHAVELDIPATERPAFDLVSGSSSALATAVEATVTLTTNELRSVLAVYESYLALPPHYWREPRSFRAAGHRLRVAEGKVKADLRRVQAKVARARGPAEGGGRYRDALISWLMSREVVVRRDLALLEETHR
jgi:hypothetical protein